MKRREFIAFLGGMALAAPRETIAQTSKIFRVGTLTVGPPIAPTAGTGEMLIAGLAQRGYTLGQNLAYEARGAAGKVGQMPNLMQELKAANVDVVVTVSYPAAAVARHRVYPR
jgi:putative tryptophan/tyrosine transport system substrate-binding protein